MFAANLFEKPYKQHMQNRPKSDMGKYDKFAWITTSAYAYVNTWERSDEP